ncbi:MAG: lytic transglycosylase domain-containing protein [Firmicutes bacterium]|nr:lytic transglycosylase domain-containing protein [Bacillota bacterium]
MKKIIRFIFAAAAVVLLANVCVKTIYAKFPLKYEEYIEKYATEYGLDKYMICGVIYAESCFDNKAHSGLARGLMQLTDATADWVSGKLRIDYDYDMAEEPEINIKMGCYYLSCLIDKYSNEETALAAYNAGMGNVSKWLEDARYSADGKTLFDIPYGETKRYVKRVKVFTYIYKQLYAKRRLK